MCILKADSLVAPDTRDIFSAEMHKMSELIHSAETQHKLLLITILDWFNAVRQTWL